MKFAFAIAAALASVVVADNADAISQISEHWDDIASVINEDLPALKAVNPSIYEAATSVIGGTELTAAYNEELVQQVATGIAPAIMNPVLSRAGVTGVTLDGNPLPTDDGADAESTSAEESTDASTDAESTDASTDAESTDASSDAASSTEESSSEEDASSSTKKSSSDKDDASSDDDVSEDDDDSSSSGAGKAAIGSFAAAAVVVIAAMC
ncbi:hypothetical protein LPJ53_001051 [Coemansia erecta]|uniref:Uncharacterized protein n=1 Tax=Coemansia erecta TaxID=147472 RepID=A0A9W8CSJ5_9FUNG|nr:hypothetical protein LPJ53_001051 [Coemansia erecta]